MAAEPADELEPLFNYAPVQPVDFLSFAADDDDGDTDTYTNLAGGKRKRRCGVKDVKGKGKAKGDVPETVFINLDEDVEDNKLEDDEDWLAPPPKSAHTVSRFQDDKTLQELRLKKQELAEVAKSAEEVLKSVIESAKREFCNSAKPDLEAVVGEPPKQQDERQKIVISIQDKDSQKQFRLYKNDKFGRLFKMYADKVKLGLDRLVFCFDGDRVGLDATPKGLGMEDDDMLEVHVKSQ